MRIVLLVALGVAACDPVHSDAVDALGDEAQGVRRGPLHRPGQPCLTCHDGALGDPNSFSVAGTIFESPDGLTAAVGATVHLTSSNGSDTSVITNAAGNFYLTPSEYTPAYPMHVDVTYARFPTVKMLSNVGRDGSCADCHKDPAGPTSAGHIYIPLDGGTP
jgi:hypothetical protein